MDCDDAVLLVAAKQARTLTAIEETRLHAHLESCEGCRILDTTPSGDWRWIAGVPADTLAAGAHAMIPTVDPIVFDMGPAIAAGGMGQVTRAVDRRLGREVAIKEVLDPTMRERFAREAMITARLQHPAIVPIYEAGTWFDGTPFYTMRLVEGDTLAASVASAATLDERVALVPHLLVVTDAIAYAHSRGVIHRDLKPTNVLVGKFGETVVIDWGLAKSLQDPADDDRHDHHDGADAALTRAGAVVGTPGFMAPEQARGEPLDERSDVYALGAMLYYVLTGRSPFHGLDASAAVAAGQHQPPRPIAELAPEAPLDLRAIAERAMAMSPDERFRDAVEMAAELRRFQSGQLVQSRTYSLRALIARWIRRHKAAVLVAVAALATLAGVVTFALVHVLQSRAAERDARVAAEDGLARARAAGAATLEEQARVELLLGERARAFTLASAALHDGRDTSVVRYILATAARDLEIHRRSLDKTELTPACGSARNCAGIDVLALGYTPTGELAVVEDAGRISFWRDGVLAHTAALGAPVVTARLDATGSRVAIASAGWLATWDLSRRTELWRVDLSGVHAIEIDPHGRWVVAATSAPRASLYDGELGHLAGDLDVGGGGVAAVAASAGGDRVAVAGGDGTLRVWSATRELLATTKLAMVPSQLCFVGADQVVADGTHAGGRHDVQLWSVTRGTLQTLGGHHGALTIASAPDASMFATSDGHAVRLWSSTGELLDERRVDRARLLVFARDVLAVATPELLHLWELPTLSHRAVVELVQPLDALAFSRDGMTIATAGSDRTVEELTGLPRTLITRFASTSALLDGSQLWSAQGADVVTRSPDDGQHVTIRAHLSDPPPTLTSSHRVVTLDDQLEHATVTDLASGAATGRFAAIGQPWVTPGGRYVIDEEDDAGRPQLTRIYDAATARQVRELAIRRRGFSAVDVADRKIAIPTATGIEQYDLAAGRPLAAASVPVGEEVRIAYDPSGAWLAGVRGHLLHVFASETGVLAATLDATRDIAAFQLRGDGAQAVVSTGTEIQLWDVHGGRLIRSLPADTSRFAMDSSASRLVSATVEGDLRLWDLASGSLLDVFHQGEPVVDLAVTERRLVARSRGTVTLWDIHRDDRDADAIAKAAERSPWRIAGGVLVRSPDGRDGVQPAPKPRAANSSSR